MTRPTPSSSTPVASGSSVPAWPTLRVPSTPRELGHDVVGRPRRRLVDDEQARRAARRSSRGWRRRRRRRASARGPRRAAEDALDALGAPLDVVGPEHQVGRALEPGLPADRALEPHPVLAERRRAPRRRPRPGEACRSRRSAWSQVAVDDDLVIVTSSSRSSSSRSSSSATISRSSSLSRAVRGYFGWIAGRACGTEPSGRPPATIVVGVEHLDLGERPHEPLDLVEHLEHVRLGARDHRHPELGPLPLVLVRRPRRRDTWYRRRSPSTMGRTHRPLLLQRVAVGDEQLEDDERQRDHRGQVRRSRRRSPTTFGRSRAPRRSR